MTCYTALLIYRLLEVRLNRKGRKKISRLYIHTTFLYYQLKRRKPLYIMAFLFFSSTKCLKRDSNCNCCQLFFFKIILIQLNFLLLFYQLFSYNIDKASRRKRGIMYENIRYEKQRRKHI